MLLPVIMAGGSGTRLWPLSRTLYPKQFLSLNTHLTMLQETLRRLQNVEHSPALVICNESHRFIVAEQLRKEGLKHSGILLEPAGRNTAPAVALAALQAVSSGEDPILLVLAADHEIQDENSFRQAVSDAEKFAEAGKLVTFGIVPTAPETGYGYIKTGEKLDGEGYKVAAFVEKPELELASQYLDDGGYLWNSGMFMFKASSFINELCQFRPDILQACESSLTSSSQDLDFIRVDKDAFDCCPEESIDYAVMEKTTEAVVVPLDARWSDVGSWSALWEISPKDANGNAVRGDVLIEDASDSYLYSQHRLIGAVGVKDLVVVETKDAVLVAHKDKVQQVKGIVAQLKKQNRSEYLQHREIFRPWGSHDTIAEGLRYQVKHVIVLPGHVTAKQIHFHRTEHWVVVSGTAKVHLEDKTYLVSENESTYIPVGMPHAIENPGKIPLEIIEVRSGVYLEEDDVIRVSSSGVGY
ncbi:mannose-1-phosphate guanylyltransferase/mannose-6-phosphate isomerase [Citrobacter portucalensis]|uniref:mannose-1-phosphate guanylyltransferase/mannose-6-phosphate isomerase n=1 Tax=Citrobacter portucalensis TaxID=1639133 RepID=UPI002B23C214|nr:mannose-1-phosphate guanylyltransferase/mannose-6-phosphate isomerase [Citrobacter portucalensis]MEB0323310.1 mannose-1-phosphate guanylyltransferase/mannose-6-phosphate isomerase [Citrobacter portucalensis]MEB0354314.1 mannose-1-phosphate guanylyltransferase/mannose-6-phosphate isomerase [Citrobacter portucalensis]MEB0400214.1 mannose-1-phosphate guanylyltransferase/mannose-6-phosphate isomerase [Citrobacter portucalensis]UDR03439.1 mannose-1-phosphate guanylyltransferase/mannose-6-phosphat